MFDRRGQGLYLISRGKTNNDIVFVCTYMRVYILARGKRVANPEPFTQAI